MQNLYHSDDLVVTRQTDGSVFLIRPNEQPQILLTLSSSEWLHMLTMELITNDKVQSIYNVFNKEQQ